MKKMIPVFMCLWFHIASSQPNYVQASIEIHWVGKAFERNRNYYLESLKDSVQINVLRFYLTQFSDHNKPFHYLIDLEQPETLTFPLSTQNQSTLLLGVDSTTQISGAQSHDIDPVHGMYWTWQSGYINLKIEGKSPACLARNHEFKLHIGGWKAPFSTLQLLETPNKKSSVFVFELDKFLARVDLATQYQIMSPGSKAAEISLLWKTHFKAAP